MLRLVLPGRELRAMDKGVGANLSGTLQDSCAGNFRVNALSRRRASNARGGKFSDANLAHCRQRATTRTSVRLFGGHVVLCMGQARRGSVSSLAVCCLLFGSFAEQSAVSTTASTLSFGK